MSSGPAAAARRLLLSQRRDGLANLASDLFSTPASRLMSTSTSTSASAALQSARTLRPLTPQASAFGSSTLGLSTPRPLCFISAPRVNCSPPSLLSARFFTSGKPLARDAPTPASTAKTAGNVDAPAPANPDTATSQPSELGFGKSERASQAAQINMRARLSREGKDKKRSFWSNMQDVVRLLKIIKPEMRTLSLAIFFLLISSAVTMSLPLTIGKIMDLSTQGAIDEVRILGLNIYQFFGAFAAFLTLGACANFGRAILLRIVGERVVARLRSQLFRKTYNQDAEFFDANRTGDLISRLGADTIIVGKSVTQNVSDGLRSGVSFGVGLGLMIWISPNLSTVLLFAGPMIGASAFFYGRITRKLSRDIQKHVGALTKIAEERLGNIKTSQAFVGEVQEVRRYNNQVRKIFNVGKTSAFWDASFFGSSGWMGNMTLLALLWFSGGLVREGLLSLGDLTTFMMYAAFTGSSLVGMGNFFSELMKGAGAADRLFELQDRKPLIPSTTGVKVKSAQGPIRFDGVAFAYPTRPAVTIFNGLNFEIPSGSNVCIVGPSGGGKSTISSLLLRFYDTTSGTITINGTDISKMNIKSLRRRIGFVSQEPVLFSGTVAENVAYGRPDASRSEIVLAAQKANCQFISDFPQGLETQVGPRGAQLSGGQKQRIAIARALLKDPDILILDEATSALDAESETLVNAALAELLKGRSTTISIAHRLSTIKRSDQIIVLNNKGTVAEMGSYTELNANKESAFSRLMEWQQTGGEINPNVIKRHDPHILESEIIDHELEHGEHEEHDEHEAEHAQQEETSREDDKSR